jgi:hypothetical protein
MFKCSIIISIKESKFCEGKYIYEGSFVMLASPNCLCRSLKAIDGLKEAMPRSA